MSSYKLAGIIIFLVVLFLVAVEILIIRRSYLAYELDTNCIAGVVKGRKAFAPNCTADLPGPAGKYEFRSNSLGFRAPEPQPQKRYWAVLGDSHVEGVYLSEDDSLVGRLQAEISPNQEIILINLGIRGTGPEQGMENFLIADQKYHFERLIWFINETDPIDSAWYRWRQNYQPPASIRDFRIQLEKSGIHWRILHLLEARQISRAVNTAVREERSTILSEGIRFFLKNKNIPTDLFILLHGPNLPRRRYFGQDIYSKDLDNWKREILMLSAKKKKFRLIDLRSNNEINQLERWPGDIHFTPSATKRLAKILVEYVL